MEEENKKQENKQKNAVVQPPALELNIKSPGIKEINTVSNFIVWNKRFICLLIVILLLQICLACREPNLKYRIINLSLILLGIFIGYIAYNRTIKIEKTVYESRS